MRKPIESNALYDRIVLDEHFVEISVKGGYKLCIINPNQSDLEFRYLLNYYSSLFEGVLKISTFEGVLTSMVGIFNNEQKGILLDGSCPLIEMDIRIEKKRCILSQ